MDGATLSPFELRALVGVVSLLVIVVGWFLRRAISGIDGHLERQDERIGGLYDGHAMIGERLARMEVRYDELSRRVRHVESGVWEMTTNGEGYRMVRRK